MEGGSGECGRKFTLNRTRVSDKPTRCVASFCKLHDASGKFCGNNWKSATALRWLASRQQNHMEQREKRTWPFIAETLFTFSPFSTSPHL